MPMAMELAGYGKMQKKNGGQVGKKRPFYNVFP